MDEDINSAPGSDAAPEQEGEAGIYTAADGSDYTAVVQNQTVIIEQNNNLIQQNNTIIELLSFCFVLLLAAFVGKIIIRFVSVIDGA